MNLTEYFAQHDGTAILATADAGGKVDAAVFSKPHLIEGDVIALLMSDRLSHANLQNNPHAAYLFMEKGPGWQGIRLYIRRLREERNSELARSLIRRRDADAKTLDINLVFFQIEEILPLIGE
jgi:Pyridoxamine 5'-phosphate oxidase